ncbi:MAG: hypothetical protein IIY21_22115 [Clostridiales bacterium]|nr:hypothetical protein [Clostridiales bacterium]
MDRQDMEIRKHFEDVIREVSMQRVMLLKLGIMEEEEIAEFMNEKAEKYTKKYEAMNPVEIMLDRLKDMAKEVENGK